MIIKSTFFVKTGMSVVRTLFFLLFIVGFALCVQGCSTISEKNNSRYPSLDTTVASPAGHLNQEGRDPSTSTSSSSTDDQGGDGDHIDGTGQPHQETLGDSSSGTSTTAWDLPESSYYHYIQFERYSHKGQLNDALQSLKKSIEKDPNALYLQKKLIFLYLSRKEENKALATAEALYNAFPDDPSVTLLFAKLKQQTNQQDEARQLYQQVLQKDAQNRDVYIILGNMYMESGNYDDAFRVFTRMANQFPKDYVPHFFLGKIHSEMKNAIYAEEAFIRCIALKNELVEPRFELIVIYKTMSDALEGSEVDYIKKIIDLYKEILEIEPHSIRANVELPVYYHQIGQRTKAAAIFTQLTQDIQQNPTYLMLMAKELIGNERYDEAAILFSEMLKRDGQNDVLNFFAGLAYDGLKENEKAISYFLKISKASDRYKKAMIHVAFLYNDMDETDKAIEFLEKIHLEIPRDIDIISYLAAMYEDKNKLSDALRILRRGLDFSPDNTEILFRSGVILDKLGKKEACIQTMKKVIAQDPGHASALNYLGYTYAELGENLDEAQKMVLKALEKKPHDGFITDSLGWIYYKKGMYKKAVEVLQKAVKLSSGDPLIIEHLGDAWVALKDFEKAAAAYQEALAKSEDKERIRVLQKKIETMRIHIEGKDE